MNSLFCRHNRFTADCPICSKGTVLDTSKPAARPRQQREAAGRSRKRSSGASGSIATRVTGPYASAGPYEGESGEQYDVRLERVPGGVRLAEWANGQILRRAPVLEVEALAELLTAVRERAILPERDADALMAAAGVEPAGDNASHGASGGRAGDMQEELRVERLDGDRLRIGRWILRPGAGWELQEAPVMLPAARYAEAIRAAAAAGVLAA
ncbi:MAG TPA: hypothetical protein VJU60_06835 [Thermoleophilaceae bacterium]|nr:hypothetical protein [Thermoleophilaceae bacterium]